MLVAILGGGLQGVEAAYLAKKADWEVILVDRHPDAAASRLADTFLDLDVTDKERLHRALQGVDLVIPAFEDERALSRLGQWCHAAGIPLAFDPDAYAISSSKIVSDRLFARLNIPAPRPWPSCSFPLVAKPSGKSGSSGVKVLRDAQTLKANFSDAHVRKDWLLQEYLEGPSYSLEVLGFFGRFQPFQVTDLFMDAAYDCKRVVAPSELDPAKIAEFEQISLQIAEAINLKGLMDVEVILHEDRLKVLEIDARLPSQTPIAVYWSSGLNMVPALAGCFLYESQPNNPEKLTENLRGVVLEHIRVSEHAIEVCGEHIMREVGPLHLERDFCGADEALTDFAPGKTCWAATLIVSGQDRQDALCRRDRVIKSIRERFDLPLYMDSEPLVPFTGKEKP